MKKLTLITILLIIMLTCACSDPESRYNAASQLGEVLWQKYPEKSGANDVFIILTNDCKLLYVEIGGVNGYINIITKINPPKCFKEFNMEN
jgi:hypothetical protein